MSDAWGMFAKTSRFSWGEALMYPTVADQMAETWVEAADELQAVFNQMKLGFTVEARNDGEGRHILFVKYGEESVAIERIQGEWIFLTRTLTYPDSETERIRPFPGFEIVSAEMLAITVLGQMKIEMMKIARLMKQVPELQPFLASRFDRAALTELIIASSATEVQGYWIDIDPSCSVEKDFVLCKLGELMTQEFEGRVAKLFEGV
ncbi:MAG TPA: hypothetical protein VK139_03065 [Microbacteriaceae bacterium]|nr:hypothetical protein [Microbacteriaceae bacterium]